MATVVPAPRQVDLFSSLNTIIGLKRMQQDKIEQEAVTNYRNKLLEIKASELELTEKKFGEAEKEGISLRDYRTSLGKASIQQAKTSAMQAGVAEGRLRLAEEDVATRLQGYQSIYKEDLYEANRQLKVAKENSGDTTLAKARADYLKGFGRDEQIGYGLAQTQIKYSQQQHYAQQAQNDALKQQLNLANYQQSIQNDITRQSITAAEPYANISLYGDEAGTLFNEMRKAESDSLQTKLQLSKTRDPNIRKELLDQMKEISNVRFEIRKSAKEAAAANRQRALEKGRKEDRPYSSTVYANIAPSSQADIDKKFHETGEWEDIRYMKTGVLGTKLPGGVKSGTKEAFYTHDDAISKGWSEEDWEAAGLKQTTETTETTETIKVRNVIDGSISSITQEELNANSWKYEAIK